MRLAGASILGGGGGGASGGPVFGCGAETKVHGMWEGSACQVTGILPATLRLLLQVIAAASQNDMLMQQSAARALAIPTHTYAGAGEALGLGLG